MMSDKIIKKRLEWHIQATMIHVIVISCTEIKIER